MIMDHDIISISKSIKIQIKLNHHFWCSATHVDGGWGHGGSSTPLTLAFFLDETNDKWSLVRSIG
jgi:hypothetical protein